MLSKLYHDLKEIGPHFGYKVIKCHLITKPDFEQSARDLFANEDMEVINGHRVLGPVIGTEERCQEFFDGKSNTYSKLLKKLSKHAKVAPQNVYKAFTNGVQQKLTFITRTTPKSEDLIEKAEKFITDDLITSLVSHPTYNEKYRKIFSLPVREGGLSILLHEDKANEYERSLKITKPFENMNDHTDIDAEQMQIAKNIKREKAEISKSKQNEIDALLTEDEMYAIKLATEKGASCWLNALPLKKYHFDLTKSEFRDGIALRYGWEPVKLPSNFACNEPFTVSHALHCPKGGYTHIRHNDIRDSFANLLNEVCDDVEIEPCLQTLQGEALANRTTTTDDDARLVIRASGLWENRFSKTFFDVKIFNPHARTCPKDIGGAYKMHEQIKS